MRCVIYGGIIKQDQVLVWCPTSYTVACRSLTYTLYPREHLYGLDHINFSHQSRNFLNGADIHLKYAHFGFDYILVTFFTFHFHLLQLFLLSGQFHLQADIFVKYNLHVYRCITDKCKPYSITPFGKGEGEPAILVGCCTGLKLLDEYRCTYK